MQSTLKPQNQVSVGWLKWFQLMLLPYVSDETLPPYRKAVEQINFGITDISSFFDKEMKKRTQIILQLWEDHPQIMTPNPFKKEYITTALILS